MAWNEVTALRRQRSRAYQDDVDGSKRSLDATLAALHYPSVLDSDVYDTEIDMSPVRVDNAQLDGWHITQNSWHYALGHPGDKANDGWVGFGGRQGAHWFKFRLRRVGYLHWPTRGWDDIGGAPNYDRANLSRTTRTVSLATKGDEVKAASRAAWSGLWSTPGGGDLSVSWTAHSTGLKELITVNEAGRNWIAANRPPGTPLAETFFGFVFELDWSDIPKITRAGVEQHVNSDFADDGESIDLTDALDRLLAFMPLSNVYVPGDPELDLEMDIEPLRKRFYRDGADHYLLAGVRCDLLATLSGGDLVFDPSLNYQVGASADDAYENTSGDVSITSTQTNNDDVDKWTGGRWQGVTIPVGATIDVATIDMHCFNSSLDEPYHDFDFEDNATPAAFTAGGGNTDISERTGTTAVVTYGDGSALGLASDTWFSTSIIGPVNVQSIVAELQISYDYSSGAAMLARCHLNSSGAAQDDLGTDHWDHDPTEAWKLHIEYTAGDGVTVPTLYYHYAHH